MFRPSKQLQAWTLLVQDGSFDSLSGAEKIEDAISAELRAAWISGDLIPNGSEVRAKPAGPTDMEMLRKDWEPLILSEEFLNSEGSTPSTDEPKAPVPRAPIDRMETISPELAELAQAAQKTLVPVLTPAPEKGVVKEETPDLIAVGKPIPPFYRGPRTKINAELARERMDQMSREMGISRNALLIEHMKFKNGGALGNLLSPKCRTKETCFGQYLAEVLGKDLLIP